MKIEKIAEHQCLYRAGYASIWIGSGLESEIATEIRFDRNGPDCIPLEEIEYSLSLLRGSETETLCLPETVVESGANIILTFRTAPVLLAEKKGQFPINAETVIDIGIDVASALHELQKSGIAHGGVSPYLIGLGGGEAGFRLFYTADIPVVSWDDYIPYLAPELVNKRSGAPNIGSDHYSLGVLLYLLSTGVFPCCDSTPDKSIHRKLTVRPEPPAGLNPETPLAVSDLICRLLEKEPGLRYQTAYGVQRDLMLIKQELQAAVLPSAFIPGKWDKAPRLEFGNKLYGRDLEIKKLRRAVREKSSKLCRVIRIKGNAGEGKTSLANTLTSLLKKQDSLFVFGKCGQSEQHIPYSSVSLPLQELVHRCLKKTDEEINQIRKQFGKGVLKSAGVMTGIIPNIELLSGPLPDVESIGPEESKYRLQLCLLELLRIIIGEGRTFSIFIDDLQWIDDASLELLRAAMTRMVFLSDFLIILAYRDDESDERSLISDFLLDIQPETILELKLDSLSAGPMQRFLIGTLSCSEAESALLASAVISKTGGNPFFTRMFLEKLQNENKLVFDYPAQRWIWDLGYIQSCCGAENVIGFLAAQMMKLDDRLLNLLNYAACLGNSFDSLNLSIVLKTPPVKINLYLKRLVDLGYIICCENKNRGYRFIHDHIQQAAIAQLTNVKVIAIHLNIARRLNRSELYEEKDLIRIVSHFNLASVLIDSRTEIAELIRMNIEAAGIARQQSAWGLYSRLSDTAMQLFKTQRIELSYEDKLRLFRQCIEAARLTGEYRRMDVLLSESDDHFKDVIDRVQLKKEKIAALMARYQMTEAYKVAEELLGALGQRKNFHMRILFSGLFPKSGNFFIQLKPLTSRKVETVIEILLLAFSTVYLSMPAKLENMILLSVKLSLKYGRSSSLPFILAMFGLILVKRPGHLNYAAKFGRLGMQMALHDKRRSLRSMVYFVYGAFIQHWAEPVDKSIRTLEEGMKMGMESGNFEYAALSQNITLFLVFAHGKNMQLMLEEKKEVLDFISRTGFQRSFNSAIRTYSFIENLTGNTVDEYSLSGKDKTEEELLDDCLYTNDNSAIASFYTYKMLIHYHNDDYNTAIEYSDKTGEFAAGLLGQFTYVWYLWFTALAILKKSYTEGTAFRTKTVRRNINILKSLAANSPGNHKHRLLLLTAELDRSRHREKSAAWNYLQAINSAAENGFVQDQALANELAGGFYLEHGNSLQAEACMREAYNCYEKWGAVRKLRRLERDYPVLSLGFPAGHREAMMEQVGRVIDVSGLLSASRAISGEMILGDLVETIMKIVIRSSGAQDGILFVENAGTAKAAAFAGISEDGKDIEVKSRLSGEGTQNYSEAVLNYTVRSMQPVILNDAENNSEQLSPEYFKRRGTKSLLCMPLLHRRKLIGCLYLENNLTRGVFSFERLELLKYLSVQIAISLENARLYESLQQSYTILQQKEEQNKEQLQQLLEAEKLASIGILAASITHEISNPNYAIHLNSEFLSTAKDEVLSLLQDYSPDMKDIQIGGLSFVEFKEKIPRVVDTILSCSQQIDSVIKELKRYIRKEPADSPESLDMNAIIESTVMLCTGFIEKTTNRFTTDLAEDLPALMGNRQRLQQALMNLIMNACQALPEKSCGICIESRFNDINNAVEVMIVDEGTGPGSSLDDMKKPFFSTKGSLGLGISISEEILKMFNGNLEYRRNQVKGTTAIVSIPVKLNEGSLL